MKKKDTSLSIFWIIIILLIGLVIFGIFMLSRQGTTDTNKPFEISSSDHVKGPKDAPIKIFEYSDFQCPACKNIYPFLKQLNQDFPDDVAIIYRHYPLTSIHPFAMSAAYATEAAAQQGQFWAMHDMLFNNQYEWSNDQNPEELFISYADILGIDVEQFKTDMKSNTVKRKVNSDRAIALRQNLRGTPSLFLNGEKWEGFSTYADMKAEIEQKITALTGKTFNEKTIESNSQVQDETSHNNEETDKTKSEKSESQESKNEESQTDNQSNNTKNQQEKTTDLQEETESTNNSIEVNLKINSDN